MQEGTDPNTHLDAKVAPINVVPQEQVARSLWIPADLEEFHQIVLEREEHISVRILGYAMKEQTYCPWMSPQTNQQITNHDIVSRQLRRRA